MTTLVHLGDFHAASDVRNPERFKALDQIIREASQFPHLGAWLWPGDLNGPLGRQLTVENRNALADAIQTMADRAPVLIVPGNHDQSDDLETFGRLKAQFPIYVVTQPETIRIVLATGEYASVFCFPYPTRTSLLGSSSDEVSGAADTVLRAIFTQAGQELVEARRNGDLTFMIGHVNVRGSIMSTGQPAIGHEIEITQEHLDLLGPIYKGLNHIHKPQEIAGAYYAGSVCRLSFGEIEAKRFLVIHATPQQMLDARTALLTGQEWAYRVESQPITVAAMYHVQGVLSRTAFTWQVKDGPDGAVLQAPESWIGTEVRVRYTFKQSELSALGDHQARVRGEFQGADRLVLEPVMEPDRALRAPAVALAKTLTEKVQAWAYVTDVHASATVLAKLQRLEQSDPVQLLNTVQDELRQVEAEEMLV